MQSTKLFKQILKSMGFVTWKKYFKLRARLEKEESRYESLYGQFCELRRLEHSSRTECGRLVQMLKTLNGVDVHRKELDS